MIPAYDGVDLIPGQLRLLNIEKELADENNPLFILIDILIEVDNGYDFCIIDTAEVLDNIGIKKLRILTAMKDKAVKYEILDRLITGESISTDEISQMNKKVKQAVIDDIEITVL